MMQGDSMALNWGWRLGNPRLRRRRRAFTLLELMLALSLAAVVLFLINVAIELHLKSLDSRRVQLEESQLARSILRVIADDVRGVVQSYQQDVSSVQAMMQSASSTGAAAATSGTDPNDPNASQGGSSADTGQSSSQGGTQDSGQSSSSSRETSSSSSGSTSSGGFSSGGSTGSGFMSPSGGGESAESTSEESVASSDLSQVTVTDIPGIFGNQYQLQMDVSRLPRPEEYQAVIEDPMDTLMDVPSDVKTVTYYVKTTDTTVTTNLISNATPLTELSNPNNYATGLVRREMDRAITSWANENGNLSGLESGDEILAPEVVSIEFGYFDGSEWLLEWDTSTEEMLPLAIQITLGMTSTVRSTTPAAASATASENVRYYSMILQLPTGGQPTAKTGASTESAGSTETGGTGSTESGTTSSEGTSP